MASGVLYRPVSRDSNGDPTDSDGKVVRGGADGTEVGTVDGLVIGGPNWQPVNDRGDVVDTTGLVGVPVAESVQPRHGDLLVVEGIRFAVKGPPQWSNPNTLTS